MKKNYIVILMLFILSVSNLFSQGNTCPQATPFCTAIGTPFTYPNVHNGSLAPNSGVNYGCLCPADAVNPSWFYIKTTAAGTMNFVISQVNNGGTGTDVDFVAWGPFASMTNVCSSLTGACSGGSGSSTCAGGGGSWANQTCTGNIEDCESSPSSVENMSLVSPGAGQYFLIMVTNYEGSAGNITITQNSGPGTDCSITCPSVLSGPGIVNAPSTNPQNGVAATPLPAVVSCTAGLLDMYATNVTPFGNPITPGVMIYTYVNNRANNTIRWYENGLQVGSPSTLTANTSSQLQVGYMSPSATQSFSFCEAQSSATDMPCTIADMATGTVINNFTWVANAVCSGYTLPAGSVKGIATWSSTCGACLTNVTDWGYASFNPGAAGIGTHTITYSFNPQTGSCPTYTTSVTITVTNPFSAAFTPPGPLCSTGACVTLTPTTTFPTGTPGWSGTGVTGSQFCPATSGTGTFAVTYSVGTTATCRATQTNSITVNASPTANAGSPQTLTCANPTAVLSASGGGTYSWTGPGIVSGGSTANATVNAPGTYSVLVTVGTCTNRATVSVSQNNTAPTAGASNSNALTCLTTTATLTGTGGGTYNWSGPGIVSGSGTANPIVNMPGSYVVTVTAANGCTATANTSVTQNTATPTAGASGTGPLTCLTSNTTLTGTGGGTYAWSGPGIVSGGATASPVVNQPGTYTVTVTAANGCTATANTSVTQNTTAPTAGASGTGPLTCLTTNTTLTGTGGGTYAWSGPGIVSGGSTSAPVVNMPGSYVVTVTAANGCTATANTSVTQNTTAPTAGASGTGPLTCLTTNTTLTGSGGGTYSWAGPGIVSGGATSSPVVNQPGTYTVTVTAANGCTATANTAVTQNITPPAAGASGATVLTCNTTTATLTGTGGGTYSWAGPGIVSGGATASPVVNQPGTYTVTVTAANGCTATANTAVTQNITPPAAGASGATVLTCNTTTATLTGTGGGTYSWAGPGIVSGGATSSPVVNQPGTYTVTVTAANGCTATANTAVTQNITPPAAGASGATVLTCNTTTATLTGTGGGTYSWAGPGIVSGGATASPVVNQPGTYTVTVTAANGCTATANTAVTQNTVSPSTTATSSGSITCTTNTINLNANLAGMNYTWTAPGGSSIASGANAQNAVGQGLGTYTLTLLNPANNCTFVTTVAAVQNTNTPTGVNAGSPQTLVCGVSSVTLTGSSASPVGATASWQGGVCGSPANFTTTACAPGTYTLVVTDPNTGCTASATVGVASSTNVPQATVDAITNSITCTNSVVAIGVTLSNSDPVTYSWTGPAISGANNTPNTTVTAGGNYTVTITNTVTNCQSVYSAAVPTNTTPVNPSIAPSASITCNTTSVTLSASPVGNPHTYSWTGPSIIADGTTPNPIVDQGGTYSVTITNTVNGCQGTQSVNVPMDVTTPTVNVGTASFTATCANPTVTITGITANPSGNVTYSWTAPASGALSNSTISNPVASGSGIFTVVVTNTVNGCSSSTTQNTVEVIPDAAIPTTTLSNNAVSITCANPTPTVTIAVSTPSVTYSWSPTSGIVTGTENTASPSFSLAGTYSAVVTNSVSGCATSITGNVVTVTLDNAAPTITMTGSANDGTLTCTTTSISISPTLTPNSDLTYTWSPSAGISTPVNQASATFTAAGSYTLAVTNTVTGCVAVIDASSIFTVYSNTTAPTVSLAVTSVTTTCASPTVQLNASSNPSAVSYSWTSPSTGSLDNSTIANPIASGSGVFTVVATDNTSGCSSSITQNTVEVVPDAAIPTATLTSSSLSITCLNPTPTATVSASTPSVTYAWSPTTGIVAGTETTANPSFSLAGTYSVVLTNTVSGCSSSAGSHIVTVIQDNATPTITLSGSANSGTLNCSTTSVSTNPTITPSSDLTYTWSPSAGISTPVNQAAATFTAAGSYTLAVTNTITGCVSVINASSIFTVAENTVAPTVNVQATSTNSTIGCGGSSSTVNLQGTITSANGGTYNWLPGSVTTPTLDVTTAGVYTLIVTDAVNSCTTATEYTVSGSTNPPQNVSAGANAAIPCGASTVNLQGSTTSTNVSYSWSGPGTITNGTTATPTVDQQGVYTLTVTDLSNGCTSTATVSVSQSNVTAAFTADPTSGVAPLTVNFTDASTGATNYSWDFGGTGTSTNPNPSHIFTTNGTYSVVLIVTTGPCSDTASAVIIVEDGLTLEIPNVFTPNNDGSNDVFTIKSTGVKEISLQIFNRWGEKMYEFSGAKAAWDGNTMAGAKVPEGTYFYFVKATGFDGKEIEKHGTVNLFR